jgi:CheY-like chemotaxis protein
VRHSRPLMNALTLDGLSSAGPAQRTLARLLKTAYGDEQRAVICVQNALHSASVAELPEDATELLDLVRLHVAPRMTKEVGPRLVAALLDDLEAEIEHERSGNDPFSSSRIALSTRMPPKQPDTNPVPVFKPPPNARPPSLTELVRQGDSAPQRDLDSEARESQVPTREMAIYVPPDTPTILPETVKRPSSETKRVHRVARPSVILVDADRFGRASLARALVQAQCDVTVLDDAADVIRALESSEPLDVVITDIDGIEIESMLRALQRIRPNVPVIAWTKNARAVAEHVLMTASITTFDVMPKAARSAEVIELVRRLAAAD